ncbi:MAG: hypothetical protein WC004_05200 [Candidatus Absconditabacterales bacterium]
MNQPLDTDPNNNTNDDDDFKEVTSMLGQMVVGLGLLALFGLSISQCSKKAIEDGYIGSQTKQKQELFHILDNQNHSATSIEF